MDRERAEENKNAWVILLHESYECGKRGDYWRSIELAEKALQLDPKIAEAWRLIGNAYELLGDQLEEWGNHLVAVTYHEYTKEHWKKAKEINPNAIIPGLGLKGLLSPYLLIFGLIILIFGTLFWFLLRVLK